MAGIGPVVRNGEALDDRIVSVIDEGKVQEIGEGIGGDDLVPLDIGAAKPAVVLTGAEELRARVGTVAGVKRPIIINQRIIPGIGLQPLVPVIDFPGPFFAGFTDGYTSAIAGVPVGRRRRI